MLQELECIRAGFPFVCVCDGDLLSVSMIMNNYVA